MASPSLEEAQGLLYSKIDGYSFALGEKDFPLGQDVVNPRFLRQRRRIAKASVIVLLLVGTLIFGLLYELDTYQYLTTRTGVAIPSHPPLSTECSVQETGVAIPENKLVSADTKELAIRSTGEVGGVQPRYLWWIVEQDWKWWATGVSMWSMASDCKDLTQDTTFANGVKCVTGVISTIYIFCGVFNQMYRFTGILFTAMNNNGVSIGGLQVTGWLKREEHQDLLDAYSKIFNATVSHIGIHHHTHPGANDTVPLDVFGFKHPHCGNDLHFSYLGLKTHANGTKQFPFMMGFGNGTSVKSQSKINGRWEFNMQYFDYGGFYWILDDNGPASQGGDGGQLSWVWDYQQAWDEAWCSINSNRYATGVYFQIYDNNHHGTIAGGALAPFKPLEGTSISFMEWIPYPIQSDPSCWIAKYSVRRLAGRGFQGVQLAKVKRGRVGHGAPPFRFSALASTWRHSLQPGAAF